MTSKRCFFEIMREDFRHKSWMLALSILGSLLAFPVSFLIKMENLRYYGNAGVIAECAYYARGIMGFFGKDMVITCGVIAIAGAFIVGLFGFRYVFHRNMVDTWHSVPVKRRTLFAVGWLNGFFIWLVPFLVGFGVTVILGQSRLSSLKKTAYTVSTRMPGDERILQNWPSGGSLMGEAMLSVLGLLTAFLLIYNLVLLAVMLCGNVLNTLVTSAVLGAGAISLYAIIYAFCEAYLSTFTLPMYAGVRRVLYASPAGAAVYTLFLRAEEGTNDFVAFTVWNLVIAAVLGGLALAAYLKRSSELAEQGVTNRPVKLLLQVVTSVTAALCGWMLFCAFTNDALFWNVFGTILVGVVVFGVLDIIFRMDFKAFFGHKALMAVTVAGSLLVGFALHFDWIGYDTYLPDKEDVAEIAVYHRGCSNLSFYEGDISEENNVLNRTHIQNRDAAYEFLEVAVALEKKEALKSEETVSEYTESRMLEEIWAKVTLENGRSYYRRYCVSEEQADSAYKLLTSPEYMKVNYQVDEAVMETISSIRFIQGNERYEIPIVTQEQREMVKTLCEVYNQDVEENPRLFIRGEGRTFSSMRLFGDDISAYTEIFEGMTHTVEAMRELGLGKYAEQIPAENIEEIRISIGYQEKEQLNPVKCAARLYGVYPEGADFSEEEGRTEAGASEAPVPAAEEKYVQDMVTESEEIYITVTDRAEIEELLDIISVEWTRSYDGVFWDRKIGSVTVVDKEGYMSEVYVTEGMLPEKYILRFGDL